MSMCPACNDERGAVVDTRPWRYGWTMRRRHCGCGYRYTIYEIPAEDVQAQTGGDDSDDEVNDGAER
jgi:transcriptional regulator NrdR family protein